MYVKEKPIMRELKTQIRHGNMETWKKKDHFFIRILILSN